MVCHIEYKDRVRDKFLFSPIVGLYSPVGKDSYYLYLMSLYERHQARLYNN